MKKIILIFYCLLFITCYSFSQWQQTGGPNNVIPLCFTSLGNNLFTGTWGLGVFISTDNGLNWSSVNNGLTTGGIMALTTLGTNLFAGTSSGGGIFLSTNNGTNWTAVNIGLSSLNVLSLTTAGTNIFAGTSVYGYQMGGIFKSTNNGLSWTFSGLSGLPITSIVSSGSNLFASTTTSPVYPEGGGVFISSNSGVNWSEVNNGLSNLMITTIIISGSNLFAAPWAPVGGGVYKSTNFGTSWSLTRLINVNINSFAVSGNNLFAASNDSGIYLSTNSGISWIRKNQGLPTPIPTLRPLIVFDNFIFVGTNTQIGTVWRRLVTEIIGIIKLSSEIPGNFFLYQNYPNPFNPVTKIKFDVPRWSQNHRGDRGIKGVDVYTNSITLKVYDILGKEIKTLVNEVLKPGVYEIMFDGKNLPSGVYFYKIQTESFSETRRMLMIK